MPKLEVDEHGVLTLKGWLESKGIHDIEKGGLYDLNWQAVYDSHIGAFVAQHQADIEAVEGLKCCDVGPQYDIGWNGAIKAVLARLRGGKP